MELSSIDKLILTVVLLVLGIAFMWMAALHRQKEANTFGEVTAWIASGILIASGLVVGVR